MKSDLKTCYEPRKQQLDRKEGARHDGETTSGILPQCNCRLLVIITLIILTFLICFILRKTSKKKKKQWGETKTKRGIFRMNLNQNKSFEGERKRSYKGEKFRWLITFWCRLCCVLCVYEYITNMQNTEKGQERNLNICICMYCSTATTTSTSQSANLPLSQLWI